MKDLLEAMERLDDLEFLNCPFGEMIYARNQMLEKAIRLRGKVLWIAFKLLAA